MACSRKAPFLGLWFICLSASSVHGKEDGQDALVAAATDEVAPQLTKVETPSAFDLHAQAVALLLERKSKDALDWLDQRAVADAMTAAELAQYWRLRGLAWGRLGQGNEAQSAFSIALRIDPTFRLEGFRGASPRLGEPPPAPATLGQRLFAEAAKDAEIRSPFQAALAALPAPSHGLSVRYQLQPQKEGFRFTLREIVDDLGLVSRIKIEGKSEAWQEEPDASVDPLLLEAGEGPWSLRLLDKNGHVLWARDLDLVQTSTKEPGPREFRQLAVAGGVTLATGAFMTLGANAVSAFVPSASSKVGEQGWFVGAMWTGAGLVAVGTGLVLYDLIASETAD